MSTNITISGAERDEFHALEQELRNLSVRMGAAERQYDLDFLRSALHDELLFRRADGSFTDKERFIADLEGRRYELLEVEVTDVDEKADSAVVTAIVTARGSNRRTLFAGTFRNVRTFVRSDGRFQCRLWINTREARLSGCSTTSVFRSPISSARGGSTTRSSGFISSSGRPFDFTGAWFAVGGGQLHLIVGEDSTFRGDKRRNELARSDAPGSRSEAGSNAALPSVLPN